ncbi:MAG: RNA polymerase sigma factor [Planctomycetota bacterium]
MLLAETLKGDPRAASTLFRRHVDSIYGYVFKRVGADRATAEDIVQDVFVDAWRNLDRFRLDGRFPAWLVGIAKRKLARHFRNESRKAEVGAATVLDSLSDDGPMPGEALESREAGLAVTRGLALVGAEVRELLLLKYRDGLSMKEIAGRLGASVEAVNSRLQRAREAFKKVLAQPEA